MASGVGLPSESIDRIFDFIDDITDGISVVILALIEMLWDLTVIIFVDLTPALGLSLGVAAWLYMFHTKFIANTR